MSPGDRRGSLSVPLRLLAAGPLRWSATVSAAVLSAGDSSDALCIADVGDALRIADVRDALRIADVEVPLDSDVGIDVVLERISGGVSAVGEVAATWTGPCARCWLPLDGQVRAAVSEVFTAEPREGEQYALGPEYADLVPMVREAVLLELPIEAIRCPHPEPCPNLPPELAAPPEGEAQPTDPRWAALEALRTQPGEPS